MNEQDGTQTSKKQRRSRKTNTSDQEHGKQAPTAQRPANEDTKAWKAYWKEQGQEWRTEPEIDAERQKYLDERQSSRPGIEQGTYPFKDIKLSRADVEWLLATHDGREPLYWNNERSCQRIGLDLRGVDLCDEDLHDLPLAKSDLREAHLERADLSEAQLQEANLYKAQLQGAYFDRAQLQGVYLREAQLQGAYLIRAQLQGADLCEVVLTDKHYNGPRLADVQWGDTNLAVVDWAQVIKLGDEYVAAQEIDKDIRKKDEKVRLGDYKTAVRAYRQLAVVLRNQGLNEDAARFAYRAQLMQRKVYRYQRKFVQYLGSLFLDLLAGYGYKTWRSFLAYLLVITAFATAYFIIGHTVQPALSPLGSFVFSMTSFHGRGFFPGGIGLDDPLTVLAAIEAFVGLLIEVTFIATLTQRLFGK